MVEEGNFVSRERLLSCGRASAVKVLTQNLSLGIGWGRVSDSTWAVIGNDRNEVIDPTSSRSNCAWLTQKRSETGPDGKQVEFTYESRINAVQGDSTGQGDIPMEYLQSTPPPGG
jgi:hypothetical protein